MKYLFTLITALTMIGASSQTYISGETDGPFRYIFFHTEDFAETKKMLIDLTPTHLHIMSDTVTIDNFVVDPGYVLDTVSFSGLSATTDYVINHGLSFTPSQVHVQAMNLDAAEWCYVHSITATTFTISFVVNPTTGTNNILMGYVAYK